MFSLQEKRAISEGVQKLLRETNHPELPAGEIQFKLQVFGSSHISWAVIVNNGAAKVPSVNPHNERMDPESPTPKEQANADTKAERAEA